MRWKRKFKDGDKVYWDSVYDGKRYYEVVQREAIIDGNHWIFFLHSGAIMDESFMPADRVELASTVESVKPKKDKPEKNETLPINMEFTATLVGDGVIWKKTRHKK